MVKSFANTAPGWHVTKAMGAAYPPPAGVQVQLPQVRTGLGGLSAIGQVAPDRADCGRTHHNPGDFC